MRNHLSVFTMMGVMGCFACNPEPLPEPDEPVNTASITVEDPTGPNFLLGVRTGFDNPELRTLVALPVGMRLDSLMPQLNTDDTITPGHVSFEAGDFRMFVTGGDGVANIDGMPTSETEGSIAADVIPWPEATTTIVGDGSRQADLFARGLRVGYTNMLVQTRRVNGDGSMGPVLSSTDVRLDPNVVLVPIQVIAIQTAGLTNYSGLGNIQGNLEVWDQVPYFDIQVMSDATTGFVDNTSYVFSSWFGTTAWKAVSAPAWTLSFQAYGAFGNIIPCASPSADCDAHAGGSLANSNYYTPDSIWRGCGTQFRLVNFIPLTITDDMCGRTGCAQALNDNATGQDAQSVCLQLLDVVESHLGGAPTLPTIIVTYDLIGTNPTPSEFGVTVSEGGHGPVACVGRAVGAAEPGGGQPQYVLAHELGHFSGQDDCAPLSSTCEFMSSNMTTAPPTDNECAGMHSWASQNWSNYWPRP